MSEIHKALAVFQLEPGSSRDAIQRRYKRLTKVWHPDRFQADEDKREAEEELKKINNANDVFKKHFETEHKATGCECQRPASASSGTGQRSHGPGPGAKRADDPEAEARRRDEDRRRKTAAEEASRKAAQEQQQQQWQQQQQGAQTQYQQAQRQQEELKWNKIRWRIAAAEGALFVALCIFGNIGFGVKEWWHDFSWKWQQDHPTHQDPTPSPVSDNPPVSSPTTTDTGSSYPPAVPVTSDNPFAPVGPSTPMLPNGVARPLDNSRVPVPNSNPYSSADPGATYQSPARPPLGFADPEDPNKKP